MANKSRSGWWLSVAMSAVGVVSLSQTGCAQPEGTDVGGEGDITEEVTDVSHTTVKNQSIGNCWSYAAAGWAESLHRQWAQANPGADSGYRDPDINMSESWITFWDWYDKLTGARYGGVETKNGRTELTTGGWWDGAASTMRTRGVVLEADFIPEEATAITSQRQRDALNAINTELNAGGRLATSSDRSNKTKVLTVLMDVWRLNQNVRDTITRVFGATGASTLQYPRSSDRGFIRKATEIRIRTVVVRSGQKVATDGTLADVVPGGRYAWRSASYPSSSSGRTDFHRRVMNALNARQPVVISWLVDFNFRSNGTFQVPTPVPMAGRQGGHLTILEDYQTTIRQQGQPDRVLRAGEMASEADQNLAVQYGTLDFYRIKNSWGQGTDPSGTGDFAGYYDLYSNYLNGPITWTADNAQRIPLSSVVLPPGF